jgi:hypothetical protein
MIKNLDIHKLLDEFLVSASSNDERLIHHLIKDFCVSNGKNLDDLHSKVKTMRLPSKIEGKSNIYGSDYSNVSNHLQSFGFFDFGKIVPNHLVNSLFKSFTGTKYLKGENRGDCLDNFIDIENPNCDRYDLDEKKIAQLSGVQELLFDPFFLEIASRYLECSPVLSNISAWWSFPFASGDPFEAAQLFHFDLDRIKWLKFFIYLTDVDPLSGPHCFIPKTHLSGSHPSEFRKRGYTRIPDEEMDAFFPKKSWIEFTGEAGTVIAVDTRGYHKGKIPVNNHRLILQFEFSNCLFGSPFESYEIDFKNSLHRNFYAKHQDSFQRLQVAQK